MPAHADVVITDTSVLVNFLAIDRMDLLKLHPSHFFVTNHVSEEITYAYPERFERFVAAIREGVITEILVDAPKELLLFNEASITRRLGIGESSAIAVAVNRGYQLAIDDVGAISQARSIHPGLVIVGTKEILLDLIVLGVLDIPAADSLKDDWARNHKFALKLQTFQDLLQATL